MLPIGEALTGDLAQAGFTGADVLAVVDASLSGSAVAVPCGHSSHFGLAVSLWSAPDIESSGLFVYAGCPQPPARCSVLWPLLTSRGISSAGSPQVRARWLSFPAVTAALPAPGSPSRSARLPARPPHLPPRLDRSASLCGASSPHRVGLAMRGVDVLPRRGITPATSGGPSHFVRLLSTRLQQLCCRHCGQVGPPVCRSRRSLPSQARALSLRSGPLAFLPPVGYRCHCATLR